MGINALVNHYQDNRRHILAYCMLVRPDGIHAIRNKTPFPTQHKCDHKEGCGNWYAYNSTNKQKWKLTSMEFCFHNLNIGEHTVDAE